MIDMSIIIHIYSNQPRSGKSDSTKKEDVVKQIYPVSKDWREAKIYGVLINDCPDIQHLCQKARAWSSLDNLNDRIAAAKEQVLETLSKNAVVLKSAETKSPEVQEFYRNFVYRPTPEQSKLSYALRHGLACCRYYHALLFILLKECGVIATACGKFPIPGSVGYTWILAYDNSGGPIIIDLFHESLTRAGITEMDYADPTGKYQDPCFAWVFQD